MKRTVIIIPFIFLCLHVRCQQIKFSFQQPKMGSLFNIVLYTSDSASAASAAEATYRMIDSLNEIFSDYIPSSELNRLCAKAGSSEWTIVSKQLFRILEAAVRAGRMSRGSFDITAGPLVRIWRKARQRKLMPPGDSLRLARRLVDYRLIELNKASQSVRLKISGMQLDLGGIAKGETAQLAVERLRQLGFPFALLDAGGDIVVSQVPAGIDGWHVAINLPESDALMDRQLLLTDKAVTTSGDFYQYVLLNGKKYSHIVDPRTGMALTNTRNVTVIADQGIDADWLTKACSILPVPVALELVEHFPGAAVQIAVSKGGRPRYYRSPGFARYFKKINPQTVER